MTLDEINHALTPWAHTVINLEPLSGGLTNQCYQLTSNLGRHFLWRPFSYKAQAFGLSPWREYHTLKALAGFAHAPQVEFVNEQGIVIEWCDGQTWQNAHGSSEQSAKNAKTISLTLMTKLHYFSQQHQLGESPALHRFNFSQCVDLYWQQLTKKLTPSAELTSFYQAYRMPCDNLLTQSYALSEPQLCHFDIGSHNIIQGEQQLYLIDWEYAAITYPVFELTLLIAEQLEIEQRFNNDLSVTLNSLINDKDELLLEQMDQMILDDWLESFFQCKALLEQKFKNTAPKDRNQKDEAQKNESRKNREKWQKTVKQWLPHIYLMRRLWFELNTLHH